MHGQNLRSRSRLHHSRTGQTAPGGPDEPGIKLLLQVPDDGLVFGIKTIDAFSQLAGGLALGQLPRPEKDQRDLGDAAKANPGGFLDHAVLSGKFTMIRQTDHI